MRKLGWDQPDVILVTGDTYIDSPYMGVAIIGRWLFKHGFRTAIIAQPSTKNGDDITRLGEPRLFWGVTAGAVDSMVANYTPSRKYRRQDDYTPGGINIRPDRASIAYTNLIRQHAKTTRPIVLGGVEASLRRIAHYDNMDRRVRRSILLDSKADILVYGMAEKAVVELARALQRGDDWRAIHGLCHVAQQAPIGFHALPSFEEVTADSRKFMKMAVIFNRLGSDPEQGLVQRFGKRYLVHNPAQPAMTSPELDAVYEMAFQHDVHPYYAGGKVRALDTIKQSITSHRGCFGQCHFCAIAVHQGRKVVSRSQGSVEREAQQMASKAGFNGIIYDVGGPTANMFGAGCKNNWRCNRPHCLMPTPCPNLVFGHEKQMRLLRKLMNLDGVKKVFIASGVRHDMVMADGRHGMEYIKQLASHHVSGQIKLAPEHSENDVLTQMNKPDMRSLLAFRKAFMAASKRQGKRQFITYYLMAAHPGCTMQHMRQLNGFARHQLQTSPRQVQIFTPTPSTLSTAMFHTELDLRGKPLPVEKTLDGMTRQKRVLKADDPRRSPSRQSSRKSSRDASRDSSRQRSRKSSRRHRKS